MNKKPFAKFLLCITALSTLLPAFAAPTPTVAKKTTSRFERIAKKLNLSSDDLATILFASPIFFGISYFATNRTIKNALRFVAIIPPIMAAALPKKSVDAIAKIPGVKFFTLNVYCPNKGCEGFCTECKGRRLYIVASLAGAPFLIRLLYSETKRIHQERIARQCDQCHYNDAHNQQTPCCNRNMCQGCSDIYMNFAYGQCPLCQANTPAHQERLARECENCHLNNHNQQTPCCNRNICHWCRFLYIENAFGQCPLCRANSPAHQERLNREVREREERARRNAEWEEDLKQRARERAARQQQQQRQPNNENNNHYQILGVAQNAPEAEIRRAYRRLALQFHPDKAAANNITQQEANRRIQQVNEANRILSNPETRQEYDQNLRINRGNH